MVFKVSTHYTSRPEQMLRQRKLAPEGGEDRRGASSDYKREPLGTKRRKKEEEKEVAERVLGGEKEFKTSLVPAKNKVRPTKKQRVAALNAATRKPVWQDDDDHDGGDKKCGQWTGTPQWAKPQTDKDNDGDSDLDELAASTGSRLMTSSSLPPGFLQLTRCPDANSASLSTGKLTSVQFHKNAQILMTGSTDRSVRLYQVDGKNNANLQNIFLDNFPVLSAEFNFAREEIVLGSLHRNFYCFDMIAGKAIFIPKIKGLEEKNMSRLRVTPDGKLIVALGSQGNIHLLSAKSKEWVHSLHMSGSVADVTFSGDGSTMFATGDDSRVYVFDLKTRQCVHHFYDDGCVQGTSIALANNYLACGSHTGVVNVYDKDTCMTSSSPRPIKAIPNLTLSCSTLTFNPRAELLALTSNLSEKAIKLVHLPSLTAFSNFPESQDSKLRVPWCLDFSPNAGYMAVGNHKGHALLYRVKHYSSY